MFINPKLITWRAGHPQLRKVNLTPMRNYAGKGLKFMSFAKNLIFIL